MLAAGEGGLLLVRDPRAHRRVTELIDPSSEKVWRPRFNLRTSDPVAVLAHSQFSRLDTILDRRAQVARRYDAVLPQHVARPRGTGRPGRVVYRYTLRAGDGARQARWIAHLRDGGIMADPLIRPDMLLHRQLGLDPSRFPVAEQVALETVSIPIFPALTHDQVAKVEAALRSLPE